MKYGFVYPGIKFLVDNLKRINLVEYFKEGIQLFNRRKTPDSVRSYNNWAIDFFRIAKWAFVAVALIFGASGHFVQVMVWYLVFANLYTYFYYHVWCDEALEPGRPGQNGHNRVRKRFVNLFFAVFYSNFCFSYLYRIPYAGDYSWHRQASLTKAFWFSISNSIAANYNAVSPITDFGDNVAMIQLLITFAFLTIILSRVNSQTTS